MPQKTVYIFRPSPSTRWMESIKRLDFSTQILRRNYLGVRTSFEKLLASGYTSAFFDYLDVYVLVYTRSKWQHCGTLLRLDLSKRYDASTAERNVLFILRPPKFLDSPQREVDSPRLSEIFCFNSASSRFVTFLVTQECAAGYTSTFCLHLLGPPEQSNLRESNPTATSTVRSMTVHYCALIRITIQKTCHIA